MECRVAKPVLRQHRHFYKCIYFPNYATKKSSTGTDAALSVKICIYAALKALMRVVAS
jgi:hypothetical protein